MEFSELGLAPFLLKSLVSAGYENPTTVQEEAIPAVLNNEDLLVSAQTGSGKTAAFLLPAMQKLMTPPTKKGKGPRVLILTPTRELAQQIEKNAMMLSRNNVFTACLTGGAPFHLQCRQLSRPVDIVVATPGRLMDHMRRRNINFGRLEILVLDEADRMLDMGFIDDIEEIVAATPEDRQTLMFSATLDGTIGRMAARMTKDPRRIQVARTDEGGKIDEMLMFCDNDRHKAKLLERILQKTEVESCVIFTATKIGSQNLADQLTDMGLAAACLHGDMPQRSRNRTLSDLRLGRLKILVATDVAARGIDVPTISHVVNYNLPDQGEDYVHRIGRTGRAGREGTAISFVDVKEFYRVRKIELYLKRKLEEATMEGLEPSQKVMRAAPTKSGGRYFTPRNSGRQTRQAYSHR